MRKKIYFIYLVLLSIMFTKTFADTKTQTKLKIFCAYHKKDKEIPIWKSDCVEPIQVGRAISKEDLGIIGDDTGDNISHKNQNYCEMTGLYWVWKNYLPNNPDLEYVGSAHYRRFLDFCDYKKTGRIYYDAFSKIFKKFYNAKNIEKYLDADIIVSKQRDLGDKTVIQDYLGFHPNIYSIDKMIEIVLAKYPQHKKIIMDTLNGNSGYFYLNFVMKREIFEDFMEWTFQLTDEFEKDTKWNNYYKYVDLRNPGYIIERLFNIWLNIYKSEHDVKIVERRLLFLEKKPHIFKRIERYLRPKFHKIFRRNRKEG